jgi:hypothetical protein
MTRTVPVNGFNCPVTSARNVVLPEPFGPVTAMRSGPVIVKDRLRMIGRSSS